MESATKFMESTENMNKPEPMEIDCSNRTRQTNWRQMETNGQKREYNSSRQRFEQQPQKMQRINQLADDTQLIPDELISNASNDSTHTNVSSVFLEE